MVSYAITGRLGPGPQWAAMDTKELAATHGNLQLPRLANWIIFENHSTKRTNAETLPKVHFSLVEKEHAGKPKRQNAKTAS